MYSSSSVCILIDSMISFSSMLLFSLTSGSGDGGAVGSSSVNGVDGDGGDGDSSLIFLNGCVGFLNSFVVSFPAFFFPLFLPKCFGWCVSSSSSEISIISFDLSSNILLFDLCSSCLFSSSFSIISTAKYGGYLKLVSACALLFRIPSTFILCSKCLKSL